MASKTYFQPTVDGGYVATRLRPQGRPKALEVKSPFTAHISDSTRARIAEQAAKYGMTASAYADLALYLFDMRFSDADNCSIQ